MPRNTKHDAYFIGRGYHVLNSSGDGTMTTYFNEEKGIYAEARGKTCCIYGITGLIKVSGGEISIPHPMIGQWERRVSELVRFGENCVPKVLPGDREPPVGVGGPKFGRGEMVVLLDDKGRQIAHAIVLRRTKKPPFKYEVEIPGCEPPIHRVTQDRLMAYEPEQKTCSYSQERDDIPY